MRKPLGRPAAVASNPSMAPMPRPWEASDANRGRVFGDILAPKRGGLFRVASLNLGNLGPTPSNCSKSNDLFSLIRKFNIDVMAFSEHGLNPRSMKRSCQWFNRISGQFEHKRSHLAWNSTWQHYNKLMWGGTGYIVQGESVRRYMGTEDDETGLARWTSVVLRGSEGGMVRIASIYVPNNREDGIVGVAAQHRNYMNTKCIQDISVREFFWNSFKDQVAKWYTAGEEIIVAGDVNCDVDLSEVSGFFRNFDMREIIRDYHGPGPETYKRNLNGKTIDGIWASASISSINCGYSDYLDDWDHRLLWIDLDEKYVFGYKECMAVSVTARRCILNQAKSVHKYTCSVKSKYKESDFVSRVQEAISNIEKEPNSQSHWEVLDNLDKERAAYMLYGEKHCRPIYRGKVPRSRMLSKKAVGVIFLKLALKSLRSRNGKKWRKCSRRKISRLQKEAGLLHFKWNVLSIEEVEQRLDRARREYLDVKEHGKEHYKSFVRNQAEQLAAVKGVDPDSVEKQLLDRDRSKAEWALIKMHMKGRVRGGLNKLYIPDPSSLTGRRECYDQRSIEEALLSFNKNEYLQSYQTPPLSSQLKIDLGLKGDGPEIDNILNGNFHPSYPLDEHTLAYFRALESPIKERLADIPLPCITEKDNIDDLLKTPEKTSSSPSGLHYGLWKANSKDPMLNAVDTYFRNAAFRHGKIFSRWKKAIDVEILKEQGNYNIERQRIIVLIEGDHQLNGKRLGKLVMKMADSENSLIAEEQYGSRKYHRATEVLLNSKLVDDSLRIKRKPGIVCSNDAKSCYNRIVHSIFAICLRRLGCHPNPIKSSIETLQSLEHHIRTGFGDSKKFYTGSVSTPLQGLVQGYGPAPVGWVAISSPLIDMMRKAGFGFKDWTSISSSVINLVCFAFVDDTDIVNTLEDGNFDYSELLRSTQEALDLWCGGLRATGGDLHPDKSFWYLVDFKPTRNGNWAYKRIEDCPGDLYLTDTDGTRKRLERCEVFQGKKALGAKTRRDGIETDNVEWFRGKTVMWADKVRTGKLSRALVWKALNHTILKSVEYPLASTCFTENQCTRIMAPALLSALPHSGIQGRLPRDLVYGPLEGQGLGLKNIRVTQLIEHLDQLMRHASRDTVTGRLLANCSEGIQLSLGSAVPLWRLSYPLWGGHVTNSWLKSTWKDAMDLGILVQDTFPILPRSRGGDMMLSDELMHSLPACSRSFKRNVLHTKEHMRALYLSDIVTPDGKSILESAWLGKRISHCRRQYRWSRTYTPSPQAVKDWQCFLKSCFLGNRENSLDLISPLSHEVMGRFPWVDYWDEDSDRLFSFETGRWWVWSRIPSRTRRRRFRRLSESLVPSEGRPVVTYMDGPKKVILHCGSLTVVQECKSFVSPEYSIKYDKSLTFKENLCCCPMAARWSVESFAMQGNELSVLEDFCKGALRIVSDGSYHPLRGVATAAIYASTTQGDACFSAKLQVPGDAEDLQSHRAELGGLFAAITIIEVLSAWARSEGRDLEKCGATVACDNKEALRIFNSKYVFDPCQKDFDLLDTLQQRIKDLHPVSIRGRWVAGHQDDLVQFDGLDWWARANVLCDNLAKSHLAKILMLGEGSQAYTGWLPKERVRIFCGNKKQTSLNKNVLYRRIMLLKTTSWWAKQGRLSELSREIVDWEVVGQSMRLLAPSRRIWVTKHASGNCGISKTLFRWNLQSDPMCPRCLTAQEDSLHVFRCEHESNMEPKQKMISAIKKFLNESGTSPDIAVAMEIGIFKWLNCEEGTYTVPLLRSRDAFEEQSEIGWGNLVMGLPSKKWSYYQQKHFNLIGSRRSGKRWVTMLLKLLMNTAWDMWDSRCDWRHRVGNDRDLMAENLLNIAIREEMSKGSAGVPNGSKYLLDMDLEEVLSYSCFHKQCWLRAVEAARGRVPLCNTREDTESGDILYEPSRKKLRRWMSTGIM